jgi:hypothetical protein
MIPLFPHLNFCWGCISYIMTVRLLDKAGASILYDQRSSISLKLSSSSYSYRRYSRTSFCFRHYSSSSRISSRSSYFMVLSALNYSHTRPFSGYSQKLRGLQSTYTTRLMSRPSSPRSFTYSSMLFSSYTMRSQCYWVKMCFIFLVGSISPITSST